jgi:hypothetical protein
MVVEAAITVLRRARGKSQAKITRLVTKLDQFKTDAESWPEASYDVVNQELHRLEEAWTDYNAKHDELVALIAADDDDTYNEEETAYSVQLDRYSGAESTLMNMANALQKKEQADATQSQPPPHSTGHGNSDNQMKMPKFEIPKFSGEYKDWLPFWNMFESSIGKNRSLSNAQKLNYLKSLLGDEPAGVIRALEIQDSNYEPAKLLLKERYHDERTIANAYVNEMFACPPARKGDVASLR